MVSEMKWTTDQQKIIDYSENLDLLVSAAAGSGKTAVMTERVRKRSISGIGDISKMLIMTFTDLAAQNMRDRIERSFRAALEDNIAQNGNVQERSIIDQQIMLLQQAQISTIHSFCWQVIQTWSSELVDSNGEPIVDAGLGVLDETRKKMLLEQAVQEVMDELHALLTNYQNSQITEVEPAYDDFVGTDIPAFDTSFDLFCISGESITRASWLTDFSRLVDSLAGRRDDSDLRELLMQSLEKIRSLADYEEWCRERLNEYSEKALSFSSSAEYHEYMFQLDKLTALAEEGLSDLKLMPLFDRLVSGELKGKEEPQFRICLLSQIEGIGKLRSILNDSIADKWDRIFALAQSIDTSYFLAKRGDEKKEFMRLYNSKISPLLSYLTGRPPDDKLEEYFCELPIHMFSATIESIEQDILSMHGMLSRFSEIMIMVDRAYMRLKLEDKAIDFSDFEHFALRLLRIPAVRDSYRERFKEIYLDEYQDTNNIQETIIRQIANDNVFMVGDIKQSIYRFRYANPALFAEKANSFEKDPKTGHLLRLNQNFRSVPGIINGVNRFFESFLTEDSGEIEYKNGHQLTAGVNDTGDARIRTIIVNVKENQLSGSGSDEEILEDSSAAKESLAVIREIRSLVDSGSFGYGDFAILGRTRAVCQVYYKQLSEYGIPVTASGERDFLDSPELRLMEALINLLDNMQQDIPLAAIMRSAIVGSAFSEEELMIIRSEDRNSPDEIEEDRHFYASVIRYSDKGSDQALRERVRDFLNKLASWREYEQFMSISELIGHIYEESGLLERVSALDSGPERVKDLELFREWADNFERSRQRGIYSFALYIRKIREKKLSERGFDSIVSVENAVQIMTIHGSKGLEFPVVFVVGAGKKMDAKSSLSSIAISEHGGITSFAMDPERSERHMTALHYSHLLKSIRAERAESYRLLYVAMTRAEKLLYIVANVDVKADNSSVSKSKMRSLLEGYKNSGLLLPVPAYVSASATTWLQLILLAMSAEPDIDPLKWFSDDGIEQGFMQQSNDYYVLNWFESDWLRSEIYPDIELISEAEHKNQEQPSDELPDQELIECWSRRLFKEYPYASIQQQPSKLTVTGLKRLQEQLIAADAEIEGDTTEGEESRFDQPQAREMVMTLKRPSDTNKREKKIKGAELGSMLHSIFQFVDLVKLNAEADEAEARRQIIEMADKKIIFPRYLSQAVEWSGALASFAKSEIAEAIRKIEIEGGPVYREMPFTIAVKSNDTLIQTNNLKLDSVYDDEETTLVQGMIDCWFEDERGVTLVDFKSDYLDCAPENFSDELSSRYKLQLDYYADAIARATGKRPQRRIIWLIRYSQAVEI